VAQFIVRAYPNRGGYRVVVDGMTDFDVPRKDAIEPAARAAILERMRAYLPPRAPPPPDPEASAHLFFEVALRKVGPPTVPAPLPEPGRATA
jgi:hypothetical protein